MQDGRMEKYMEEKKVDVIIPVYKPGAEFRGLLARLM